MATIVAPVLTHPMGRARGAGRGARDRAHDPNGCSVPKSMLFGTIPLSAPGSPARQNPAATPGTEPCGGERARGPRDEQARGEGALPRGEAPRGIRSPAPRRPQVAGCGGVAGHTGRDGPCGGADLAGVGLAATPRRPRPSGCHRRRRRPRSMAPAPDAQRAVAIRGRGRADRWAVLAVGGRRRGAGWRPGRGVRDAGQGTRTRLAPAQSAHPARSSAPPCPPRPAFTVNHSRLTPRALAVGEEGAHARVGPRSPGLQGSGAGTKTSARLPARRPPAPVAAPCPPARRMLAPGRPPASPSSPTAPPVARATQERPCGPGGPPTRGCRPAPPVRARGPQGASAGRSVGPGRHDRQGTAGRCPRGDPRCHRRGQGAG